MTISYGPTVDDVFEERQKRLRDGYFFQCNCSQCIKDCQKGTALLKCTSCTGPVLNSTCLVCSQLMEDADEKVKLLDGALTDLEIKTKLMGAIINSGGPEKIKFHYTSLGKSLQTIVKLIYSPSSVLFECLYKTSRVFYQMGNLKECLALGELVDCLMPLKPTHELLVISKGTLQNDKDSLVDVNIDHLIFWCYVYRVAVERTESSKEDVWSKMFRFNARLKKLIKLVLTTKEGLLSGLQENKDKPVSGSSEMDVLQKEVYTLAELKLHMAKQLAQLKAKFAFKQIDFAKLKAESLAV